MTQQEAETGPRLQGIASIAVFGLLMLAAILLIHLFATPELPLGQLWIHAAMIAGFYTLGFALVYLPTTVLWSRFRPHVTPPVPLLIAAAVLGLVAGFLLLAGANALGLGIPHGGHRDPYLMWRVLPVGAVIVWLYLASERTREIKRELGRLGRATSTVSRPHSHDRIELHDGRTMALTDTDDILFAAAQENYCEVVLRDGRRMLIRSTLADLLKRLPQPPFARTHRSYLINLDHALSIGPSGRAYNARIAGATGPVPVSRSYVEAVARSWRSLGA